MAEDKCFHFHVTRQVVENATHFFHAEDEADADKKADSLCNELMDDETEPKGLKWSIRKDFDSQNVDVLSTEVTQIAEFDCIDFEEEKK